MNIWFFLIVAVICVVAIPALAGIISDYKLAKLEKGGSKEEIENLKTELRRLKKRLENVEAIAAGDPDGFEKNAFHQQDEHAAGEADHAHEIENILKRKRTR